MTTQMEIPKIEGTELRKVKRLEGTPFDAVKLEGHGWFLAIGRHRLTEEMESEKMVIEHLNTKTWEIIMQLIGIAINNIDNIKNEKL